MKPSLPSTTAPRKAPRKHLRHCSTTTTLRGRNGPPNPTPAPRHTTPPAASGPLVPRLGPKAKIEYLPGSTHGEPDMVLFIVPGMEDDCMWFHESLVEGMCFCVLATRDTEAIDAPLCGHTCSGSACVRSAGHLGMHLGGGGERWSTFNVGDKPPAAD